MRYKSVCVEYPKCLEYSKELPGRIGQKFCNPNCKSAFHYRDSKFKELSTFVKIDTQLKLNRRILKNINLYGKSKSIKDF
jgi:hypothetical protein